jgi:hypothetical protein
MCIVIIKVNSRNSEICTNILHKMWYAYFYGDRQHLSKKIFLVKAPFKSCHFIYHKSHVARTGTQTRGNEYIEMKLIFIIYAPWEFLANRSDSAVCVTMDSWVRNPLEVWMYVRVFIAFVLSCVGRGLAASRSPTLQRIPTDCLYGSPFQ